MTNCPICHRPLHENVGYGISQIVIDNVRYCLNCKIPMTEDERVEAEFKGNENYCIFVKKKI